MVDESGNPIGGASVWVYTGALPWFCLDDGGRGTGFNESKTDSTGRFVATGVESYEQRVSAWAPGFCAGEVIITGGDWTALIVLQRGNEPKLAKPAPGPLSVLDSITTGLSDGDAPGERLPPVERIAAQTQRVQVLNHDGSPAQNEQVRILNDGSSRSSRTDRSGRLAVTAPAGINVKIKFSTNPKTRFAGGGVSFRQTSPSVRFRPKGALLWNPWRAGCFPLRS